MHEDSMWGFVSRLLPENLEEIARETGLVKRLRGFDSVEELVRVLLAYTASGGSYRTVSAWARASGIARLSSEGLFYRFAGSERFFERLLSELLPPSDVPMQGLGYRVRLVDATYLAGPGADRADWMAHVAYDPALHRPAWIHVTPSGTPESLARHEWSAGDLVVADAGYAHARGLHAALATPARILVRFSPYSIRLCELSKEVATPESLEARVPLAGPVSFTLLLPVPPEPANKGWSLKKALAWHEVRVVALRDRKGEAVWLLTNLAPHEATDAQVCQLYRLRWQVELFFKRMKSLGGLDGIPTRDGPTARAWILAKLVVAALAVRLLDAEEAFSPYGYPVR